MGEADRRSGCISEMEQNRRLGHMEATDRERGIKGSSTPGDLWTALQEVRKEP